MSHDAKFHALLTRVEEQVKMAPLQAACTAVGGANRARRMAQYGAYKKGVQSLQGKVVTLSETDQLRYAQLLLPDRPDDLPPPAQRRRLDGPDAQAASDIPDSDPADSQELPTPKA